MGLGWLIFSLAFVGFGLNTGIIFAWLLVALYGFHSGLIEASERAYPATLAREEERATILGWYYFAFGIGSLPASLIFGWVYSHWGASVAFLGYAGLTFLTIPLLFLLPTDRPKN
jgi:MFS family permease